MIPYIYKKIILFAIILAMCTPSKAQTTDEKTVNFVLMVNNKVILSADFELILYDSLSQKYDSVEAGYRDFKFKFYKEGDYDKVQKSDSIVFKYIPGVSEFRIHYNPDYQKGLKTKYFHNRATIGLHFYNYGPKRKEQYDCAGFSFDNRNCTMFFIIPRKKSTKVWWGSSGDWL